MKVHAAPTLRTYDVINITSGTQLIARIRSEMSDEGDLVLNLVVVEQLDEITARRQAPVEMHFSMHVSSAQLGPTGHLIGTIEPQSSTARLEWDDGVTLTVFDTSPHQP